VSARGITIVSASAGSGKTYRLTEDVTRAVDPSAASPSVPPVPLEGLVAVTFTKKAHAELAARIRHRLVTNGAYDEAMRLPLAYLGTVHAACLRLLQEFALDAGLSPNVDVVAEDPKKLLRQALETALPVDVRARLETLSARVELRWAAQAKRYDWVTPVADIMDLARSNRIPPEALPEMAERSAAGLLALLPEPLEGGEALDARLRRELDRALEALEKKGDGKKNTANVITLLRDVRLRLEDGEATWSDWTKLATCAPSKACEELVFELRQAAADYERHPGLRADVRDLTFAVFEAARVGLSAYQSWKTRRRIVDYVDMLDRALDLVEHPRVKDELARRLELVVVDEFQDTSPIQLALFVRLHALATRSIWVGDRKQCIFEYAGADPLLMDAVASWVARSGGARDTLAHNYRSRPELASACSALFSAALARHDFSASEVVVTPKRDTPLALAGLSPLGLLVMETSKKGDDAHAVAEGVRKMLAAPTGTPVVDRLTGETRPLRPGDVAILVATNQEARDVATALHAREIRAAIARAGLLSTPEGTLADAALRWLLDAHDTLAAATLDALTGYGGRTADAWLADRLRGDEPGDGWRAALAPLRDAIAILSPGEALDAVLAALDAATLCARWPDAPQRLANLDALRAIAQAYEERAAQEREAATVAGLLRTFDDLREERLQRDEMLASDDQHVTHAEPGREGDDGAVMVCTYHKAKGLEWPVVVLASLDREERRNAFEVASESDAAGFDPARPLEGRWIRYWPWPFGQTRKVPLAEHAAQSVTGKAVTRREDKERARLLYVGFTRARDHLVLAVRVARQGAAPKTAWLDALSDAEGAPLLELPVDAEGRGQTRIAGKLAIATRVMRVGATLPEECDDEAPATEARWFARAGAPEAPRVRYGITPSAAETSPAASGASVIDAIERLPHALPVDGKGYDFDVLGNAVHAFLAADVEGLAADERMRRAERLLAGAGLAGVLRAVALARVGEQLRAWASAKWPGAVWRREVPVDAFVRDGAGRERRVRGILDLLLETSDGVVIIDHKTFPGTTEAAWRAKCATFAPQLRTYAEVVARAGSRPVLGCWVHLPVGGGMVKISPAA
jgi:ATP-dependent helicase/nuclease subunit A